MRHEPSGVIEQMASTEWVTPEYSRQEVNSAGAALLREFSNQQEQQRTLAVVNNWRGAHAFPLNTFQMYLRDKTKQINKYGIVAQRTKRLPAIRLKLAQISSLKLAQMQDIGGCRAVAGEITHVKRLKEVYDHHSFKHELINEKNYIDEPRTSGYRGIHQIYSYYSDKNQIFNGLKVEVQLRTWKQHFWATAVEIVGMFEEQALKSGLGDERWLRFFALMGSVLALREMTPLVSGTPENRTELLEELRFYVHNLDVIERLNAYSSALKYKGSTSLADYYLLRLAPQAHRLTIGRYNRREIRKASEDYIAIERRNQVRLLDSDAVLVAADSIKELKTAYPNYFADASKFIREVKMAIETNLSPNFYPGVAARRYS